MKRVAQKRPARATFLRTSVSRLTIKGQITISAGMREALNLKPGEQVLMSLQDDASIRLTRIAPIEEVIARLPKVRLNMKKNWRSFKDEAEEEIARQAMGQGMDTSQGNE